MLRTSSRFFSTLTLLVLAIAATTTVAHAQTLSVVYNFGTNSGDPHNPTYSGGVVQGRDGNLYSKAGGGALQFGAMFNITPGGTLTVQYSFDSTDQGPYSGLTLGADGNFYGTTVGGGLDNLGTVFKITPSGAITILHSFTGSDGVSPYAPPIQGSSRVVESSRFWFGVNFCGLLEMLSFHPAI